MAIAFPPGNLVGEIFMHDHPYYKVALGRAGPETPIPNAQLGGAWYIPSSWNYGHLDYLPGTVIGPAFDIPVAPPRESDPPPRDSNDPPWKPAWSAAAVSTATK
jgi:hypothetical protein